MTAEYFCSLIGVSTVETTSIKTSNSIEGEIEEYGQKNMSSTKRNLLNEDEILRLPASKLLANLRGNKPIILDKIIYTEHLLAKKLKDESVLNYNPKWIKNISNVEKVEKIEEKYTANNEDEISWDTF